MTTKRSLVRSIGVLALVAAMAACGSSNKSSSGTTTGRTTGGGAPASETATGSPIKVGVICSCSGPLGADVAAAGDVTRAWAKSVNASGGLNGHPIDLIFYDDASNPGKSVTDAQALISDHVAVIEDDSTFDSAWASAVTAAKIPVIGGTGTAQDFFTNPDFYDTLLTEDAGPYAVVALAKQAGASNIGSLYCAEAAVCAQLVPAVKAYGQLLSVPETYSSSVAITAPNYTAQCVAAQQGKVTAIFSAVDAHTTARVGGDCDRQGYDPIYVVMDASYTPATAAAPGINKNLWVVFSNLPYTQNAPEVQAFNKVVDQYYPGLRQGTGGTVWNQAATSAWTAGLLIRDAVKGSGTGSGAVTAATMTQGLDTINKDTLDGWAPPLTFTAGQPHPVDCWFGTKIVNGTPTLLNGGQPSCHSSGAK